MPSVERAQAALLEAATTAAHAWAVVPVADRAALASLAPGVALTLDELLASLGGLVRARTMRAALEETVSAVATRPLPVVAGGV
jgi:hypothetical protein